MRRTDNGLKLDFTLQDKEERLRYVNKLIEEWDKEGRALRKEDLELIGNYLLYGKDSDGSNPILKKEIEIETKYTTYQKKKAVSLDELISQPTFNEGSSIRQNPIPYKLPKVKFSREEARAKHITELEPLFKEIDKISSILKAKNGELEDTPENQEFFCYARSINPYRQYQLKHLLIELRKEQYTIRDYFCPTLQPLPPQATFRGGERDSSILWQEGTYEIAPLGLFQPGLARFINQKDPLTPDYTYNQDAPYIFDFRNPEHIYQFIEFYLELETASLSDPESTLVSFLATFQFYMERAKLTPEQLDILQYKIKKYPNQTISEIINKKYLKNHTPNYISTIYKKGICVAISEYAILHYDEFCARKDPTKWKQCKCCKEIKLKDPRNFVRKSRSSDQFSTQCKVCDKNIRDGKKSAGGGVKC